MNFKPGTCFSVHDQQQVLLFAVAPLDIPTHGKSSVPQRHLRMDVRMEHTDKMDLDLKTGAHKSLSNHDLGSFLARII